MFAPTAVGVKSYELRIYNRWGEEIFNSKTPEIGWDGNFPNGKPAPFGAYTWSVFAKGANDKVITKTGIVTLLN